MSSGGSLPLLNVPISTPVSRSTCGIRLPEKGLGILCRVPAGQTTSYGAIAAEMGTPLDARDVTDAIANNTIAILIPCHRVVKKDGSLSGYRMGAKRKRALLAREQHHGEFRLVS